MSYLESSPDRPLNQSSAWTNREDYSSERPNSRRERARNDQSGDGGIEAAEPEAVVANGDAARREEEEPEDS